MIAGSPVRWTASWCSARVESSTSRMRPCYECAVPDPVAAALASWLRSNGAPALIPRRGVLLALVGPFLLIGFMLRSLLQTVMRRSSSMVQVVPLLLVALTLSFFSTEVWQTIGRLHGLPLVLTTALFVALPERLGHRLDAAAFDAAVAPPLRRRERANLIAISVLTQVITASVIGL